MTFCVRPGLENQASAISLPVTHASSIFFSISWKQVFYHIQSQRLYFPTIPCSSIFAPCFNGTHASIFHLLANTLKTTVHTNASQQNGISTFLQPPCFMTLICPQSYIPYGELTLLYFVILPVHSLFCVIQDVIQNVIQISSERYLVRFSLAVRTIW